MLGAAGAETITTENRAAGLRFEGHGVGLAALIADYLKSFAFRSTASLLRSAKVGPARVAARLAAFRMTQSTFAIVILFSFGKGEGASTLGASDFNVWHIYLPRKPIPKRVCAGRQVYRTA